MKIGIDARLYRSSTAGIGRYSQNLIKNLLEIDPENQYVLLMTAADAAEFKIEKSKWKMTIQNVKIIETNIDHYSITEQTKLPAILKAENCDLWHFLNFNVPVNFKEKYVVTIHDLTLFFYPGRSKRSFFHKLGYKYIFKKTCQNAQKIIAVSQSTKNDIHEVFKTELAKIKVIYEAADDKNFKNASDADIVKLKKDHQICDQAVILYVGQWRHHKNLTGLIEAFNELRGDMKAKLVIVGKIDPLFPEVLESIDKSPYNHDIIKTGFVNDDELAAWYRLATVFIAPSFYEGFGLPGLEAMVAGLPVVSSDRTSLPEIYQKGALYFNPSDSIDMKDKIKKVIIDSACRERLIREGKSVVEKFSWAKTAQETLAVYKEVVK